jgi:hypothetical protein
MGGNLMKVWMGVIGEMGGSWFFFLHGLIIALNCVPALANGRVERKTKKIGLFFFRVIAHGWMGWGEYSPYDTVAHCSYSMIQQTKYFYDTIHF